MIAIKCLEYDMSLGSELILIFKPIICLVEALTGYLQPFLPQNLAVQSLPSSSLLLLVLLSFPSLLLSFFTQAYLTDL